MISIIIPVFNAEKYIEECLNSIVVQDIDKKEIEILCINNGSTDNSSNIIRRIKEDNKDKINISLIETKKLGVSKARNLGIYNSCGEYLMFLDADDFLAPNALNVIANSIWQEKKDIYLFDYYLVNSRGKCKGTSKCNYNGNNLYDILIEGKLNAVWSIVYKRDFLKKINAKFNMDYIIAEDLMFNLEVFTNMPTIKYINMFLYNYRQHNDSVMHSQEKDIVIKKINNVIAVYFKYFEYLKKWKIDTKLYQKKVASKFIEVLEREMKNIVNLNIKNNEKTIMIKNSLDNPKVEYVKNMLKGEKKLTSAEKLLLNNKIKEYCFKASLKEKGKRNIKWILKKLKIMEF